MADRLTIYRGALRLLGNAAGLSSLTEEGPGRRALDDVWQGAGDLLLSKGMWNFALRSVEISNDEDVEPLFGYQYAMSKPDDWVRTVNISDSPTMREGYEDFRDEPGYWYVNVDPVYIRYVSDHTDYGWNVGAWGAPFAKAMEAYMAFESGLAISSDKGNRNDIYSLYEKRLKEARMLDAVDEAVSWKPRGRLVRSRSSRSDDYRG